ncbi:biotin transporter BioY, partial [Enterocloster sp.]
FVAAAWITGKLCWKRPGGGVAWRLFSAFWGMMAYYLCGMVYFYVISNYVIHMPVSWKLVVINCFLITAAEDFILCVMAAVVARRLMPFALGQYR